MLSAKCYKMDKQYLNDLWSFACRDNDEVSFKQLFTYFFLRLVRFSMIFVRTKEEAEEVVSDVFIKLWNYKDQDHKIEDIASYLYTATRNQSINNNKRHSSRYLSEILDINEDFVIENNDPEKDMEWKEIYSHLEQAINSLPPQCQAVFRLIREDGIRYKEAAAILNISPRTVETYLERAIHKLSASLSDYMCLNHR